MEENKSFESALEELEVIVKELESGNASLDDAINKYSKAMELAKYASEKLNNATKRVNKILTEEATEEDFRAE